MSLMNLSSAPTAKVAIEPISNIGMTIPTLDLKTKPENEDDDDDGFDDFDDFQTSEPVIKANENDDVLKTQDSLASVGAPQKSAMPNLLDLNVL